MRLLHYNAAESFKSTAGKLPAPKGLTTGIARNRIFHAIRPRFPCECYRTALKGRKEGAADRIDTGQTFQRVIVVQSRSVRVIRAVKGGHMTFVEPNINPLSEFVADPLPFIDRLTESSARHRFSLTTGNLNVWFLMWRRLNDC